MQVFETSWMLFTQGPQRRWKRLSVARKSGGGCVQFDWCGPDVEFLTSCRILYRLQRCYLYISRSRTPADDVSFPRHLSIYNTLPSSSSQQISETIAAIVVTIGFSDDRIAYSAAAIVMQMRASYSRRWCSTVRRDEADLSSQNDIVDRWTGRPAKHRDGHMCHTGSTASNTPLLFE